jgi:hypothetical protein
VQEPLAGGAQLGEPRQQIIALDHGDARSHTRRRRQRRQLGASPCDEPARVGRDPMPVLPGAGIRSMAERSRGVTE